MIDMDKVGCRFLSHDHLLIPGLRLPKPTEQIKETAGKRTGDKSSEHNLVKKAKVDEQEAKLPLEGTSIEQPGNNEILFEFSDDEDETKGNLVNGEPGSQKVYFCKHCDFGHEDIRRLSTHYEDSHPYIRCNSSYVKDSSDKSATFRCLMCPVEFENTADLKNHCTENHPEAPDIFTAKACELSLAFKCFVCTFTCIGLKGLKEHYKENHATYEVDNPLVYYQYSMIGCQTDSPQPSPEKPRQISPGPVCTSSPIITNVTSIQLSTLKSADKALYNCIKCNFSHKSVVVMHVHYQKSHPEEAITMDNIRQLACISSALQMTPAKPAKEVENYTPPRTGKDSSKKRKIKVKLLLPKKKRSLSSISATHKLQASKNHSPSLETKKVKSVEGINKTEKLCPERSDAVTTAMLDLSSSSPDHVFYCRLCDYTSDKVRGVIGHHNAKHSMDAPTGIDEVVRYSAEVKKAKNEEGKKGKTSSSTPPCHSEDDKQVDLCSETKIQLEEDCQADVSAEGKNPYEYADNLFYCQKCNLANPTLKGVVNHQAKQHRCINSNQQCVRQYTASVHEEIRKLKSTGAKPFSSFHLPLPILNEGDEERYFCHFCNYRHGTVTQVLHHYCARHPGYKIKASEIYLYSEKLHKHMQTSHVKMAASQVSNQEKPGKAKKETTEKPNNSFSVSPSPSVEAPQTQRSLNCYRCSYSSPYVYLLKRHMFKTHQLNRSAKDILRICFKQGNIQSGYHCEFCIFTHQKESVVFRHYREEHSWRSLSLEYIKTRLYVGAKKSILKKKEDKPMDRDHVTSKLYSCKECFYKGSSKSRLRRHYRNIHCRSVGTGGSMKASANAQEEDYHEMPGLFDSFQVPLEFDKLDEAPGSPTMFKCTYCPATFDKRRGLNVHLGMKHPEASIQNLEMEQKTQTQAQVQSQPRMHFFTCPHCTYVNTIYQGVLTHCQKRHPALPIKANSLHVESKHIKDLDDLSKINAGSSVKVTGHMCDKCSQIWPTVDKLNKHQSQDHSETVSTAQKDAVSPAPKPSPSKPHSKPTTISKASTLSKTTKALYKCPQCSYKPCTKIAFCRHMRKFHNHIVSKDSVYRCTVCSNVYLTKKHLSTHYTVKHGMHAYLKHFLPVDKETPKNKASTSPDHSAEEPQNTSETNKSDKIFVYKCPSCPYLNASYHGTLTHCQMRHPHLTVRADKLETGEILVTDMVRCTLGRNSNNRGYQCKNCPEIHATLKKLKVHCDREHSGKKVSTEVKRKPVAAPPDVSEVMPLKSQTPEGSAIKAVIRPPSANQTRQSSSVLVRSSTLLYKCEMCAYKGTQLKYLQGHYRHTHKLDMLTTRKLLIKYYRRKYKKTGSDPTQFEERDQTKCKQCPDLTFESPQLLINHYVAAHLKVDFVVLSLGKKKTSTGLYRCCHCNIRLFGARKLWYHMDLHRARIKGGKAKASPKKTSLDKNTSPDPKSVQPSWQDETAPLGSTEKLPPGKVMPVERISSLKKSPQKLDDVEQPEQESTEVRTLCKQCGRMFNSLKGLRSHERSHAALAAINKVNPSPELNRNIRKYIIHKSGTVKPFLCRCCPYRTNLVGLWRSHFMKNHQDVLSNLIETDDKDEESNQMTEIEPPEAAETANSLTEFDEEPELAENSLYLEPPDVQRQLNHYNLMAQSSSKASVLDVIPESCMFHCELCNFSSGHLSSIRRHYLNRHGKKILRCKDCEFFTGSRKTLEMHIEAGHTTCQSVPTHLKDLRCPFCLYQTKNKNNMIDHIILHREVRVVPIEVRRPKLSRYLQGVVFRCHKCTFTSGSAENLRLHMTRHDDIKPYKCRLCYFDCCQLSDLEAHLSNKHQVIRNHELVGQVSLDQLEARAERMLETEEERLSNLEEHSSSDDAEMEFATDCEVLQGEKLDENNTREESTSLIEEPQWQQVLGVNSERSIKGSVLDIQCENEKLNTGEQQVHGQDSDSQEEVEPIDTESGHKLEKSEHNAEEGKNTDVDTEKKEIQASEDQAQPTLGEGEDTNLASTHLKKTAGKERSETYFSADEKAQDHKLHTQAVKQKTQDMEATVDDDMQQNISPLDEDGSISRVHDKRTVEMEQDNEAQNPRNHNNTQADSVKIKETQLNETGIQESPTAEWNLTPSSSCAQVKVGQDERVCLSLAHCKPEQGQAPKMSARPLEADEKSPVLENESLKNRTQGTHHIGCFREDAGCVCLKREEGDEVKEADSPRVHKDEEDEALRASHTEEKAYTCDLCGRNLPNSSDLKRHTMRHLL